MAGLTKESQTTSRNYLPTTFGAWDTLLHVACKKNYIVNEITKPGRL